MILIVARQQNGRALGRYDLENEIQDARLDPSPPAALT